MKMTKDVPVLVRNKNIDIGTSDVPDLKTFQTSELHTYFTSYDLSEQWGISLAQATRTFNKTTHRFLHTDVLQLDQR